MDRRGFFALAPAAALAVGGSANAAKDDVRDVAALLAEYQAAWTASDAARMFQLATDNVHWVNIVGMHWQGKAQAELAHKIYLESMFRGVPLTLEEVESIVPLSSDTLAVVARWSVGAFTPPSGQQVPAAKDRMSLILLRTANGLRIAHGANVQIDPVAQQFDPAKGPPSAPRAG